MSLNNTQLHASPGLKVGAIVNATVDTDDIANTKYLLLILC